jgi:hypothetical protein
MPLSGGGSSSAPVGGWLREQLAQDVVASLGRADNAVLDSHLGVPFGAASLDIDGKVPLGQLPGAAGGTRPISHLTASHTLAIASLAFSELRFEHATGELTVTVPGDSDDFDVPEGTSIVVKRAGAGTVLFATSGTSPGTVKPTVENVYINNSTTENTYPVPMPSGIVDGDAVLITLNIATISTVVTWPTRPAEFVLLGPSTNPIGPSGAGTSVFLAKNVAASAFTAGTLKTFATGQASGTGQPVVAITQVFSGADPTAPVDVFAHSGTSSVATNPTALTVAENVHEVLMKTAGTGATAAAAPVPHGTNGTAMTLSINGATGAGSANMQAGVATGVAGSVPAGTQIGGTGRTWAKPDGTSNYGPAVTLGLKPAAVSSVILNSDDGHRRIGKQFRSAVLTKVGPNTWDLDGFLAA